MVETFRAGLRYFVGFVCRVSGVLALFARSELGEIAVIVALPVQQSESHADPQSFSWVGANLHFVVEDLGLSRLGFGNQRLVENIEHILADLLKLILDLLAVITDGADVLVRALGLSFCSIEEMMRQEARRVPTTFL